MFWIKAVQKFGQTLHVGLQSMAPGMFMLQNSGTAPGNHGAVMAVPSSATLPALPGMHTMTGMQHMQNMMHGFQPRVVGLSQSSTGGDSSALISEVETVESQNDVQSVSGADASDRPSEPATPQKSPTGSKPKETGGSGQVGIDRAISMAQTASDHTMTFLQKNMLHQKTELP